MTSVGIAARVRPPQDRALRVRHRILQTPVVRFEHRRTGRAVTVVGVVHIAPARYYRQLNAIITKLEAGGALVCYEYVGRAAEADWSAVSPAEREGWDAATARRGELAEAACRYLGWVGQAGGLVYAASWRNVDMNEAEIVQRADAEERDLLVQDVSIADLFGDRPPDRQDIVAGVAAATLMRVISLDRYRLLMRVVGEDLTRVVVGDRNERALASLPSDQDAVLIWGSQHLPGLAAGLDRAGYRRGASTWVNTAELPSLWASARAIGSVLRADRRDRSAARG